MRESSSCPDPEVLAAFIDGRLSGDERRRVVVHLDRCADCYEVFSETVRFQGEEEPRGRVVGAERFAARRWLWPAAAAAAAAAVVAILVALPILRVEPERPVVATLPGGEELALDAGELVSAMDPGAGDAPLGGSLWGGWPDGEGLGFAGIDRETVSFRVGVRLLDVRATAAAADREAARTAVEELAAVLEAAGAAAELADLLERAREAVADARFDALANGAADLEAGAHELLEPSSLAFGKWAEAGRLAAARGDGDFFLSPAFTRFAGDLAAADLPEPLATRVAAIRSLTAADLGVPEPAELEELRTHFGSLVALH